MFCKCGSVARKYGRYCEDAARQRWRCVECGRIFTHDRRSAGGSNFMPGPKRTELKRLLVAGVPVRAAARVVGVSHISATRYYRLWRVDAKCPCGQPSTHQGWCSWRLQMTPDRQSWLGQQWGRRCNTDVARLVREGTELARAQGHVIGTWVWGADGDAGLWPYTKCRVCGSGVSISGVPGAPTPDGKALTTVCQTPTQREQQRQLNQEKRKWREGKRTLSQLKTILRSPSRSLSVASTPEPTSPR